MGHYVLLLQLFVVVATVIRIERLWNFKLNTWKYGRQRKFTKTFANKATLLRPDLIRNKVALEKRLVKVEKLGKGKGNFLM